MKILLIGHARHGKDTVAAALRDHHGYSFASSSLFCAANVVRPYLARRSITYASPEDCYEDRHNHRELWHRAIRDYTLHDPTHLARAIFEVYDIYVGMRHNTEFNACRNEGVFDISIWVDRGNVLPPENISSMKLAPWMADYVLDNNGTLVEMRSSLSKLVQHRLGGGK